jgi:hypothetical protein
MKLPLRLDVNILTVLDAENETVCSAYIGRSDRWNAEQERNLRRLVAAANFTQFCDVDGMERLGTLPMEDALRLSLDPETHFGHGPGPRGLVR